MVAVCSTSFFGRPRGFGAIQGAGAKGVFADLASIALPFAIMDRNVALPIWPLAQHVRFVQNWSDGSIGSDMVVCIHSAWPEPSKCSSFSPFFTSERAGTSPLTGEKILTLIVTFLRW